MSDLAEVGARGVYRANWASWLEHKDLNLNLTLPDPDPRLQRVRS